MSDPNGPRYPHEHNKPDIGLPVICTGCGRRVTVEHYIEVNNLLQAPICKVCHGIFVVCPTSSGAS